MMDEEESKEALRFGCFSEICDAIVRALDESSASEFGVSSQEVLDV